MVKNRNMKKIILILLIILMTGCSFNLDKDLKDHEDTSDIEEKEEAEEEIEEIYKDDNPLKVAFYQGSNNVYEKVSVFKSPLNSYKDIGMFCVILDYKDEISGNFKELYNNVKNSYSDFKYKIGYNISFTLKDGKSYDENILKPIDLFAYTFSNYLYIWLYDDINTNGWHSHLEEKDYNENTIMSSIKLMATDLSREVVDGFNITVFTYDSEDDFDSDGHYRGNSKFTLKIVYEE